MGDQVTTPLVRDNFPWLTSVFLDETFEEALGRTAISPGLQKHVNDLTVLINSTPQIALLSSNLHKDFINEKSSAESLMPAL